MIDSQLIESAKYIRKEYLSSYRELLKYEDDIKNLSKFLFNKVDELKTYNDDIVRNIKTKDDIAKVSSYLISEIQTIEDEEKKLTKKVSDINGKLEKLRSDEQMLYQSIKNRYPDLSDEDMSKEIHSHLPE